MLLLLLLNMALIIHFIYNILINFVDITFDKKEKKHEILILRFGLVIVQFSNGMLV